MNETQEKIQRTSKKIIMAIRIVRICCLIGILACIVTTVVVQVKRDDIIKEVNRNIEEGNIDTLLDKTQMIIPLSPTRFSNGQTAIVSIYQGITFAITNLVLFMIMLKLLSRVFAIIRDSYSPFVPEVMKKLRIVFIIIFVMSFRNSIIVGAITGLGLFCLYQIYAYGCELQKQADETL